MSRRQEYAYGIIPYFQNDEAEYIFFIGQQIKNREKGFWKFPKGHTEDGETLLETAVRETQEEIGINTNPENVITDKYFTESYIFERGEDDSRPAGEIEKINMYLLGKVVKKGELAPEVSLNEEFAQYRWATYEEALELLPENSQKFLKKAHGFLQEQQEGK